jgi:hypothetical protein
MLRSAFVLLSSLQIGVRMKQSLERLALAGGLFIVAAVFGLLAAYHALVSIYQFSALEAAAIMATCLLLVGLMVLVIVPLIGKQAKRASPAPLVATGEGTGLIVQGLGKVIQQISPVRLIALAFVVGLLASRR